MSIFGPGVGGGFLAAAGAVKGLGEGITTAGQVGVEQQRMEKQNQMALDREKTIQQLQQTFQASEAEKGRGFQKEQTEREISGRSAVAKFEQGQKNERMKEELASREKVAKGAQTGANYRAEVGASGRIGAAGVRAGAGAGKGDKPDFMIHTVQIVPKDANGRAIPAAAPETHLVAIHKSGQQYMQVGGSVDPTSGMPTGGKMVLFDAKTNQPTDLSKFPRPNAGAVSDLINNPDQGHAAAFQQRYGWLPSEYFGAVHEKEQQAQGSASASMSARFPIFNYFGKGAQVTHSIPVGGGATSAPDTDTETAAPQEPDTSPGTATSAPQSGDVE
jgi:hypothetical protein